MEQNFQTSFIPKKPMIEERVVSSRPVSMFTILAIFILLGVLFLAGGFYIYRGYLKSSITKMENDLELAKNRFEPSKISELQVLDKRLKASTEVLSKHIAITPVFEALEAITLKSVRYTKFDYILGEDPGSKIEIKLKGQAIGYLSIALQADLFTKNENLIDPVFSNLSLDEKGNVLFDLTFMVDASFVDYKRVLETEDTVPTGLDSNPVTPTAPSY